MLSRPSTLLVTLALISGCASNDALQTRFTSSMEAGELLQAERQLQRLEKRLDPDDLAPHRARLNQHVTAALAQVSEETRALLAQQQWHQAFDKLQSEQKRLGHHEELAALENRVLSAEKDTLERLHREWMRDRAALLARHHRALQASHHGRSDLAEHLQTWLAEERPPVLAFLAEQSREAATTGHWQRVLDTQAMLRTLDPDAADPDLVRRATARLADARDRAQARQHQHNNEHLDQLYQQARSLGSAASLHALQTFTEQHRDTLPAVKVNRTRRAVQQFIREKTRQGDHSYARSQFHEAQRHWQEAHQLAPQSDTLRQKLTRVERVLSSLQALEN